MNTELFEAVNARAERKRSALDSIASEQLFFEIANRAYDSKTIVPAIKSRRSQEIVKAKSRSVNMVLVLAFTMFMTVVLPIILREVSGL